MSKTSASINQKPRKGAAHSNRRYVIASLFLFFIVVFRLGVAAFEFENWRGFAISTLHTFIVAAGTVWCLWEWRKEQEHDI
jgi:sarcosine oxidase gamma subunit